jgi:hypothetical protein
MSNSIVLSEIEAVTLAIVRGLKSSYRKEQFERSKVGYYNTDNPVIVSLAKKGLLKVTKTGISLGDRSLVYRVMSETSHPDLKVWDLWGLNTYWYFKKESTAV